MKPFYQKSGITLYNADCRDVAKFVKCDFILTDPPYPDYLADEYGYFPPMFLNDFSCRQLVFWSAKADFMLDYSAVHIWDKKTGAGSEYERIFERNGQKNFKVFRHYLINSTVAASFTGDVFTGHKSQKPIKLLRELLMFLAPVGSVIFDPFSGSGRTLVACQELGYQAVGCEVSEKWCSVTVEGLAQQTLFTLPNTACSGRLDSSAQQSNLFTDGNLPSKARGATRRR